MVASAELSYADEFANALGVPVEMIGGLPIAAIDRADTARLMVDVAALRRASSKPALVFTSANGQVLSMCAHHAAIRNLFLDVAKIAQDRGTTFYLLGGTSSVIEQAVCRARSLYPRLKIVGYRDGY